MKRWNHRPVVMGVITLALLLFALGWVLSGAMRMTIAQESFDAASSTADQIAHGKYLVHHVAKCIECHTRRDSRGNLMESRLLLGAPIPVEGPAFVRPWAAQSSSLAGLGNYNESFVHYLLTHGVRPDGSAPKSPMPSFQLNDDDAHAVTAYLKSIRSSSESR